MKVILASASARRRKLLKQIIPKFRVMHPRISEELFHSKNISRSRSITWPRQYVQDMARAKAKSVLSRAKNAWIIGADTIVWTGRKIIGKPRSKKDAFRILKTLAGTRHSVITGVSVLNTSTGRMRTGYEETILRMTRLSDDQIRRIVSQRRHLDKAGGYAIQESGDEFIKIIRGRLDNAVGLPLNLVRQFIRLKMMTHHCRYDV